MSALSVALSGVLGTLVGAAARPLVFARSVSVLSCPRMTSALPTGRGRAARW
ncbi:hypothetical protein ACWD25_02245 [Streptomyces sp. NPDC002920]